MVCYTYRGHILMLCYIQVTYFDVCYTQVTCFECTVYSCHVLRVCCIQLSCFEGVLYTTVMFWGCAVYNCHVLRVCYMQLSCFEGVLYTTGMFWRYATQLTCFPPENAKPAAKNTNKLTTVNDVECSHSVVPNPYDQHNSKHVYSRLHSILTSIPSRSIIHLPSLSPCKTRKLIFSRFPHQTPHKSMVYRRDLSFSHGADGDLLHEMLRRVDWPIVTEFRKI